jgi:ribosomal protein S18 acetylase RimI-like enzyme
MKFTSFLVFCAQKSCASLNKPCYSKKIIVDIFLAKKHAKIQGLNGCNIMTITFRPARSEDAELAARLIAATMGLFCDATFGLGDHQRALRVIQAFYLIPDNRFSQRLCTIAEWDAQPAGLLLAIPGKDLPALMAPMARQLWQVYPWYNALRFIWRIVPLIFDKEANKDELLISNLAVEPKFQGKGIGRSLLVLAEKKAREARLPKCALEVDLGNSNARQLYVSQGYHVVSTHHTAWFEKNLKSAGFERMSKTISE